MIRSFVQRRAEVYNVRVMRKISIVGIDNCGKTAITRSFEGGDDIATIHLTSVQGESTRIRTLRRLVAALATFGERHRFKTLTGFAYLLHLIPYAYAERALRQTEKRLLLSDRDPILDTLCYADVYIPKWIQTILFPHLRSLLTHFFPFPDAYLYVDITPSISATRMSASPQLHESTTHLSRLKFLFERHLGSVERNGVRVFRIVAEGKPLDAVAREVRDVVMQYCGTPSSCPQISKANSHNLVFHSQ